MGEFQGERLRKAWEKLLRKATLVAADDERGSFVSPRDAFTKKSGLMYETVETPWDIQVQGRASSLYKGIRDQRGMMAGAAYAKGGADGSVATLTHSRARSLRLLITHLLVHAFTHARTHSLTHDSLTTHSRLTHDSLTISSLTLLTHSHRPLTHITHINHITHSLTH